MDPINSRLFGCLSSYNSTNCNDFDGDGCDDNTEDTDDDADGCADTDDENHYITDTSDLDNDGLINDCDLDDNDGICSTASDSDGVCTTISGGDACAEGETGWTSSSCQEFVFFVHANGNTYLETINPCSETDNDVDGCQDSSEDTDDDNDGVADTTDNCKNLANADQIQIPCREAFNSSIFMGMSVT